MKLTPTQAEQYGQKIIDLLELPLNELGRVDTIDGDKTAMGLGRTLQRYLEEAQQPVGQQARIDSLVEVPSGLGGIFNVRITEIHSGEYWGVIENKQSDFHGTKKHGKRSDIIKILEA